MMVEPALSLSSEKTGSPSHFKARTLVSLEESTHMQSRIIYVRVRKRDWEHESIFETHTNLLKYVRTRIESAGAVRGLGAEPMTF